MTQGKDCLACMGKDNCVFKDDDFYEIFEKIKEADGLILGSPVYGVDISAEMKIFLDRLGLASMEIQTHYVISRVLLFAQFVVLEV
ncbi:flavodoxin family protein [Faecalitalea cylindroides]|uniref:Flavodoxin family protein n=1 Tax=Faecalitalea cylindroides TaxID=39483 RepID=A0AAW6FSQ3_9FIRM|nr:flavodoxin family protein [Faecalitalea cylindroides]MDC0828639.1 flavodoxin family protein [Faecalitalea cylindroides]